MHPNWVAKDNDLINYAVFKKKNNDQMKEYFINRRLNIIKQGYQQKNIIEYKAKGTSRLNRKLELLIER